MYNTKKYLLGALAGIATLVTSNALAADQFFAKQQAYWQDQVYPAAAGAQSIGSAQAALQSTNTVRVGVIDGAFAETPDLTYSEGYNFVTADGRGTDFLSKDADLVSTCEKGHGTAVSSIIAAKDDSWGIRGVFPSAELVVARVTKCGTFARQDLADAITWMAGGTVDDVTSISSPVNVISVSLSTNQTCENPIKSAVEYAISQGITVVASVGNADAEDTPLAPSDCPGVIGVGSVNHEGLKSVFSNLVSDSDISAMGEDVYAPTALDENNDGVLEFASWTGTSFSTPIVSGIVAMLLSENNALKPYEIDSILKASAGKIIAPTDYSGPTDTSGRDCGESNKCGFGVVNALKAIEIARNYKNDTEFSIVNKLKDMNDCDVKFLMDSIGKTVDVCSVYSLNVNKNVDKTVQTVEVYEVPSTDELLASNGTLAGKSNSGIVKLANLKDSNTVKFGYRFCTSDIFGTYSCQSDALTEVKNVDLTKPDACN